MKDIFKIIGAGIGAILLVMVISTSFGLFGLSWNRFAAPYQEETRRLTYDESRSYNQGMALDVGELCRQWRAEQDEIAQKGIANTILQRADRYDWSKLPSQQQRCLEDIEGTLTNSSN